VILALEGCCFAQHVRVLPDSRKKEFRGKGLQSIALPHYNIPKKEVRFFPRAFVEYTTSAILKNRNIIVYILPSTINLTKR